MVFTAVGDSTNVVDDVDLCIFNIAKYIFHGFLGKIRRTFESHWQYVVPNGVTNVIKSLDSLSNANV